MELVLLAVIASALWVQALNSAKGAKGDLLSLNNIVQLTVAMLVGTVLVIIIGIAVAYGFQLFGIIV